MKKIFTHLFAVLLLSFVTTNAWAQTSFTVDPTSGSYNGSGTYCTGWTSNSGDYTVKISVPVNNMATAPATEGTFEFATGSSRSSTWTFVVDGYRIQSYSLEYKLKETATITVNGNTVTADWQTLSVTNSESAFVATLNMAGDNKCVVIQNLTFTVTPILENGKVYRFTNKSYTDKVLTLLHDCAYGLDKVESGDANYYKQLWCVETTTKGQYKLVNLSYGEYLAGNGKSAQWNVNTAVDNNVFQIFNSTDNYISFRSMAHKDDAESEYCYMHCANQNSYKIVGWSTTDPTLWSFEEVAVDDAVVEEALGFRTSLKDGSVYRFENKGETTVALSANGLTDVKASTIDENSLDQQWLVTKVNDNWVFRNLATGRYLCGGNAQSTAWTLVEEPVEFALSKDAIKQVGHNNNRGYMHRDGSNNIVSWSFREGTTYNANTQWVDKEIIYTEDELKALIEAVPTVAEAAAYKTNFRTLFTDDACVTPAYTIDEIETTDAYTKLSSNLKALVDNIYTKCSTDDWSEDNADDNKLDWESKYAKKFRVQMYEPYSIAGDITSWLGINSHSNNDNPTGIYVPEAGIVYIMVEGTIGEGASLRLINGGSNGRITNATTGGYELSTGLNIINFTEPTGMLYVCYNVDTYDPDGETATEKFPHKLSDYAPLKIHIEGGAITGFYNAQGDFRATTEAEDLWKTITGASVDCDEDWVYMEERANLSVVPVLGHRQILLFSLNTTDEGDNGMAYYLPENINIPTKPYNRTGKWSDFDLGIPDVGYDGYKVNIMMEAWDRIMYSQLATMGVLSEDDVNKMNQLYPRWTSEREPAEMYDFTNKSKFDNQTYQEFCNGVDYGEYFNHHGLALGVGGTAYMYGSGDHCGYHHNTMSGIIRDIAYTAGSTWGPAHEIGHQHQDTYLLNGQTEVTNNLFANVALWYKGMSTSRYNGSNGSLESVLNAFNTEGSDTYTNNIWALTHLYYRLWLYYHLAGNNTQFWPRLYELLRVEPLQNGGTISGDKSLLLFYKHACAAAGEDLTEFFRAHGFLSVMDNRLVGDYANATYNVTQEMIDEAIAEVKAMKDASGNPLKENLAIIFICDDAYGSFETDEDDNVIRYVSTVYQHDGTTLRDVYGETNPNSEFGSVTDFINGDVDVSTNYTATVSSDGTVTMSGGEGGVGFLVLNDEGEVVSFSNKSTFSLSSEAAYLLATGKANVVTVNSNSDKVEANVDLTDMRFALLQDLIEKSQILASDTSTIRVGYYKPDAVVNLQSYIEDAEGVITNGDAVNLQAVYELLYNEYNAVVANEFSRVLLVPGSKYAILAKTNDRILSFSDTTVVTVADTEDYASTANNQWYVEKDGAFHIKNAGNSKYIQNVTDQNGLLYTVGDEVVNMNINEIQLGCYSIATSTVPGRYMNMDGGNNARVITWGDTGDNSQWKFILLEENETNAAKEKLLELAKKTLALVDVVATVNYSEGDKLTLTTTEGEPNYIWSNAAVSGNGVDKLLDSDKDTYFHSQWNNSTAPTDGWGHHITVDLGADADLTSFKFKYTTRNQSNLSNYPKTIEVYGSDDNTNYTLLQVVSGLKTGAGVDNEAVVMGDGNVYRYLRFLVTDAANSNSGTNTGSDGKVFFHMSEFSLCPVTVTAEVKSEYAVDGGVTTDAVTAAYIDAEQAKAVYNSVSATIDNVNEKKTALQSNDKTSGSYITLLNQYNAVVSSVLAAKKGTLKEWVDKMTDLMKDAGTVNAQGPMSVDLAGKLYAHKPYTAGGESHSDYSSVATNYNLLDSKTNTHFHSDYSSDMPDVPYIRVDLGEGKTINEFTFNYTTRSTGTGYPTTIKVYGGNTEITYDDVKDTEPLATFTTSDANNPMPKDFNSWTSTSIQSATAYRFFVFAVTTSSVNKEYDDVTRPYFVMSEFGFTECGKIIVNLTSYVITEDELLDAYYANSKANNLYTNAQSVAIVEQAITDLQAAYNKLYAAMNNTAALKANLKELIDNTQALYDKMATDDGAVNEYYSTSALTADNLSEALAMITAALAVYDNSSATVDDINAAYYNLNEKYTILKGIEDLDVTDRGDLNNLIATMQSLLEQTTVNGAVETGNVALQVADKTAPFYIWNYKPATDDNGIAALIDETDGVANTGTFTGTYWQDGEVEPYTHYLEIDLGVNNVLEDLSIDYTTRSSGYGNQRPNGLKFLGSNDKETYEEFHSVISGLTTDANTKWTMPVPIELAKNYRYVRIAVSTEAGYFNMSDFNLYSSSIATVNEFYSTSDIFGCLPAVLRGCSDAKKAVAVYLLSDDYADAKEALQLQIDALQAIIGGNVDDRTELKTLADETEPLVTEVAAFDETETELEMQCDDPSAPYYLYCNADGTKTNGSGDNVGVAALVGENKDNITHLHTTYGDEAQDDDLDHYLRLDMGEDEAIMSFKFSYTGRSTNSNNDPSEMIIQGCNTLDGDWEEIVSLTNLPTDGDGVVYNSDKIESDKAFRYIRFMVTATQNGAVNNGHPFFVLSKFSVTACKTIEVKTEYVSPNLPLSTLVTANNEMVEASAMVDDSEHYVTETAYSTAKNELQAARDALELAMNLKELPVVLTTDASNPVLYKIRINRSSTTLLQYDHASTMVAVADDNLGNEYQAWYFMQGKDDSGYDDVMIYPYWGADAANTSLRLGSNDISNGDSKVKAVDGSDNAYKTNWYITFTEGSTAANWWNIQPEGKATYFSNHGGVSKKMGFHNSADDDGSEFQFILDETDYSLSDAYYALYNLYNSYGGTKVAGTAIGCYISVDAYNSAYNAAATLIENKNATDEEYIDARTALEAAYAALERRMPIEGGFYRLKSAFTGNYSDGQYIYADAENNLYFSNESDVLSKYIWQFEVVDGGYNVKNLHTNSYIQTALWGEQVTLKETAGNVTLDVLDDATGILNLKTNAHPLHAQQVGSKIVGYKGGLGSASAWYIEEVEDVDEIFKHTETLSTLGYGTLMLNYDAKVPDGVTAYVANGVEGFEIVMVPVENDIVPANTAVILKKDEFDGNALEMPFKYSNADISASYGNNMLRGTLFTKVVKCDTDDVNNNIYMMQNKNGAVKMYWMYENYNETGERVQVDGSYNHDEGGYVRCTANRAYLVVPQNNAQGATAFSFRFSGPTTGVDEVNGDGKTAKSIYDLQGRKLSEITESGIYIVDGKKVYVK